MAGYIIAAFGFCWFLYELNKIPEELPNPIQERIDLMNSRQDNR